jgi:uncharacterized protein YneF (UPF0154 family)
MDNSIIVTLMIFIFILGIIIGMIGFGVFLEDSIKMNQLTVNDSFSQFFLRCYPK